MATQPRDRSVPVAESMLYSRGTAGWPVSVGPFSSLKAQNGPRFGSIFGRNGPTLGGPGDRNFDAGPSRDLNFDPLSWFEPAFWEERRVKKISKCEHSKNHKSRSGSPKMHVV